MAIDCLRRGVLGLELHTSAAWCADAAAVLVPEEDGVGLLLAMSTPGVDMGKLSKPPPSPTPPQPPIIAGVLAFEVAFERRGALIAEPRKEEEEAEAEKELILVVLVEAVVVLLLGVLLE